MASKTLLTLQAALLLAGSVLQPSANAQQGPVPPARPGARATAQGIVNGAGPWTVARRILGRSMGAPAGANPRAMLQLPNGTMAMLSMVSTAVDKGVGFISPATGGTALNLKLVVPSTGLEEFFSLHVPAMQPGDRRPMVVGFHSFNRTHLEIEGGTDLFDEAVARGWFALAPVQRSDVGNPLVNYGSIQSQDHVEAVMDWVLDVYRVDRDRIYGVGFSMGGGSVMSYAARHRDRRGGAFAAVANHTGTVGLHHVYAIQPDVRAELELLFGGSPSQVPFEYQRCSTVELDGNGLLVPGGEHMAVNLAFTGLRTYYAIQDPLAYLQQQSQSLTVFMQSLPFAFYEQFIVNATAACLALPPQAPAGHCWDSLPTVEVYDWFASKTLIETPPFGTVLADRSARWNGFELLQDIQGAFSSFDYVVDRNQGLVELLSMENVRGVTFDLEKNGFDTSASLEVRLGSGDNTGQITSFRGLTSRPSQVTRNGLSALEQCVPTFFPTWCYDQSTGVLTVVEPTAASATWTIVP